MKALVLHYSEEGYFLVNVFMQLYLGLIYIYVYAINKCSTIFFVDIQCKMTLYGSWCIVLTC